MKRRWRKQHSGGPAEVNITAFMNLMVILVPFLLITAVFSRITVLDLNLPAPGTAAQQSARQDPELQLEVTVRDAAVEIGDRRRGLLKTVPIAADGSHLTEISQLLQQIKARHPDKQNVTLLLESDISYERMVEMMDTLRVARVEQEGQPVYAELFPTIAIGDAPVAKLRTAKGSGK